MTSPQAPKNQPEKHGIYRAPYGQPRADLLNSQFQVHQSPLVKIDRFRDGDCSDGRSMERPAPFGPFPFAGRMRAGFFIPVMAARVDMQPLFCGSMCNHV